MADYMKWYPVINVYNKCMADCGLRASPSPSEADGAQEDAAADGGMIVMIMILIMIIMII